MKPQTYFQNVEIYFQNQCSVLQIYNAFIDLRYCNRLIEQIILRIVNIF